jgi:hypothetical protein
MAMDRKLKREMNLFMFNNWQECIDSHNCLNMTLLAESAMDAFNYHPFLNDDIEADEDIFYMAFQVNRELVQEGFIDE